MNTEGYDDKLKELLNGEDLAEVPKKSCDSCDQSFPLHPDFFHKDNQKEDGFRSVCSSCREAQRQHALTKHKTDQVDQFEEKIATFIASTSLEFEPGVSRKENVGELYAATLDAFGGIKNMGKLVAIVFAKGSTQVQLRLLELMVRMSVKVTEMKLSDQSYEDMSPEDLMAEIQRKSRAAKMPAVAAALMESMEAQNKSIADKKAGIIDVDHEKKEPE